MKKDRAKKESSLRAFSLLEILVALVLISLSFSTLILVQARATRLALQSKRLSVATNLARLQFMECKNEVEKIISSATDYKLEGNFASLGFDQYSFECHAPRFNMRAPSAQDIEQNVKKKADQGKVDTGTSASAMSPFVSMITDTLSNSVRELAVIIRWQDGNAKDEMRVVSHVIDPAAMSVLARTLQQGAEQLSKTMGKDQAKDKDKDKDKSKDKDKDKAKDSKKEKDSSGRKP
jgi:type II secretory pathway pseudopilin PulG